MVQPPANLLEPLSFRGSKDHRIISHAFGVVQLYREGSLGVDPPRTLVEVLRNFPMNPALSGTQRFENVR